MHGCFSGSFHIRFVHTMHIVGGVAQWLERWSMSGELSLACALTCS